MKIKAVIPNYGVEALARVFQTSITPVKASDTEVTFEFVRGGVESIENTYDEQVSQFFIIQALETAEKEGYDAATVLCAGDPAIGAARDILNIPVVGIFESAVYLACLLGRKFSVITVLEDAVPLLEEKILVLGLERRCASVRSVDIPVLDLEKDHERMVEALAAESRRAVLEDRADTIVLGCAGMSEAAREVSRRIGVPVVDPVTAGIKMLEVLHALGLSHSRKAYFYPRPKRRVCAPITPTS
jgi:allantoin racemase